MGRIISERKRVKQQEHSRSFRWADDPGSGFGFKLVNGRVVVNNARAWRFYQLCVRNGFYHAGEYRYDEKKRKHYFVPTGRLIHRPIHDAGIVTCEWTYVEPAVMECSCGERVELDHIMFNTCPKCGADYDSHGSKLAPRSQWGEETGESFSELAAYNYDVNTPASDYAEVDY